MRRATLSSFSISSMETEYLATGHRFDVINGTL